MRFILFFCVLFLSIAGRSQKFVIRDVSIGYRVGEGEAVGSNPYTLSVYLKKPAGYLTFLNSMDVNSMNGSPGPVTYQRVFLHAELSKQHPERNFWKKTTIPVGINFAFREPRSGMMVEENERYSGNKNGNSTLDVRRLWLVQKQSFIGLHTGLHRRLLAGRRVGFVTGVLLQGEIAIRHRFEQRFDSLAFDEQTKAMVFSRSEQKPELKGRNYFQWSVLIPLAAEINLHKNRWLLKPEITVGWQNNRYLRQNKLSQESINAALWAIYRRK